MSLRRWGIKVRVIGVWVWAGPGNRAYEFPTFDAAAEFVAGHWTKFGDKWKARNLRVKQIGGAE